MVSRVLVPVDDSEMSKQALRHALEVYPSASITVLHVVGEPSSMMGKAVGLALEDDVEEAAKALAEDVLAEAEAIAAEYDVEVETAVAWGRPGKVIVERAEDYDAVVIGSHGGSVAEWLFVGNVAQTVFRRSPVPVTVVR